MMVPFVDREISAARTWLYQPETNARHPLASVRLKNEATPRCRPASSPPSTRAATGSTNFVGDAQLPLTAKGTSKFVTFALDAKTDIRRIDKGVKQHRARQGDRRRADPDHEVARTLDYEITPPTEEDRDMVVDEPRGDGWKPAAGEQGYRADADPLPPPDHRRQGTNHQGVAVARAHSTARPSR